MAYPLNTPLGRFGIRTDEESEQRCVATIPVHGLRNPVSGAPTIAPLAMLVDHIGGLINHCRRADGEWTVSSELSLEVGPDTLDVIEARPGVPVTGVSRPLGRKGSVALGLCELSVGAEVVATATVRSCYIGAPADLSAWPGERVGARPGHQLADLMAVQVAEAGGTGTVLMQGDDPVLNNSVGAIHGGVSSMGLELVGSAEINRSATDPPFRTASLRVNFLRPFHGGAQAHYIGRPLHAGRRSGVAETQAVGNDGRVALIARVTAYR